MLRSPVFALCAMCLTFASAAQAANGDFRRPDRDDHADGRVPRRVVEALRDRYPRLRFAVYPAFLANGTRVFPARIYGRGFDANAQLTEHGDFLYGGFPDISLDQLPPPVKEMVFGMMGGEIQSADRYEHFDYQVDCDFGRRREYRITMDAAGRVKDVVPLLRTQRTDYLAFPRAERGEEEAARRDLDELFPRMRVRSAHRHPEHPGYFYLNFSTPTEADVIVLAGPRRDVVESRFWLDQNLLPDPCNGALSTIFPRARVSSVYLVRSMRYTIIHPKGAADPALVSLTPLGELLAARPVTRADRWREMGESIETRPLMTYDPRDDRGRGGAWGPRGDQYRR